MIRCRRHFGDLTSTKGVCASCLRQRLFALQHQTEPQNDIVKSPPPPASPHRISDEAQSEEQTQMFFTPQHDSTTVIPVVTVVEEETTKKETTKNSISNMIMGLFRSKKHDQDHEKKESRTFSIDENARGMSPDRENICVAESCKQTPRRTPRRNNRHSRNVSGFAICLSPLVWASPNVRCGGAGSGGQAEFCKNRSRKLADFGRNNNNKY